jgi:Vacuolar sorting-associated protein 13, N-terminal
MGPLNVAALDKEETKKRVISAKMQKLKMVDRLIDYPSGAIGSELDKDEAVNSNDDPDKVKKPVPHARATYVQQWTSKIIDNIEITLKNVHVRYEDSQTIPSCPFSSGLTLSSFTLSTCDENWQEKFVARDINKQSSSIRKIAKVCSFGLYWSTKSVVLSKESFRDWSTKMQIMIYPGNIDALQKAAFDNVEYILHPANNLVVRLIHNELTDKMKPKFDMTVESTNLVLKIDRLQYLQLLRTMEMIGVTERQRQPHMYRPYERPSNPQNARAWWRYACKMVIKRGRYINLVKLSKSVSDEYGIVDMRTADEKNEARQLEQRMPLRSLVMFRHFAAKEMHDDLRKRRLELKRNSILKGYDATVLGAGKGQRTWVRWLAGIEATAAVISNNTDESDVGVLENAESPFKGKIQNRRELEGDVSIASIISSLEKEGETAVDVSSKAVLFRLTLTTSATLDMAIAGMPVASATMALTTLAEITTWGVTATVNMRDVQVLDMCTDTPAMKNIIAVRQQCTETSSVVTAEDPGFQDTGKDSSDQIFSVIFENLNNRTVVRISALPLEISLNKLCVQRLIGMFLAPSSLNATARSSTLKTARNKCSTAMKSAQRPASVRKVSVPAPAAGKAGTTKKVPRSFFIDGMHAGSDDVDFKFRVIDDVEDDEVEELDGKDAEAKDRKEGQGQGQGQGYEEMNGQDVRGDKKTDNASVHDSDNDLEIVFEAQAPKIIVHLDSSSDRGYLLLDTGYLTVKGLLNSLGMSWDVSLKEVNASMPHSVKDMYSSSLKSLYLIKPFHIAAKVQTTDTSTADMTVDVSVSPEVRGELDTVKLTRLLQVLPVITATFTRANCLASVARAEEVLHLGASSVLPSLLPSLSSHPSSSSLSSYTPLVSSSSSTSYSTPHPPPPPLLSPSPSYSTPSLPPAPTSSSSLTPTSQPGTAEDNTNSYLSPLRKTLSDVEESELFRTPPESPPTYNLTEVRHLKIQTVSEEDLDIVDEIIADSQSILLEGRHVEVEVVDPSHVTMVINVKISEVALDLSYDVSKGRHVVLALHMLDIRVLFRPFDMQVSYIHPCVS